MKILTNLQERKKDIWSKSPFVKHSTQTAFKVNTETNIWYCFETQQGGNLTDFVKALSKIELEQEWKPIETMPKEHINVLAYLPFNFIGFQEVMQINTQHTDDIKNFGVTHWMPLPQSPIQK